MNDEIDQSERVEVKANDFVPPPKPSPLPEVKEMRVAGHSNSKDLAGSIAKTFRGGQRVRLSAIGSQAVCQAVKAVPIANGYLGPQGVFLVAKIAFKDKQIEAIKKHLRSFK